jgi:hypothetical protein
MSLMKIGLSIERCKVQLAQLKNEGGGTRYREKGERKKGRRGERVNDTTSLTNQISSLCPSWQIIDGQMLWKQIVNRANSCGDVESTS